MSFINLKGTSEYSITQSINRIDSLVSAAADNNMGALGLCDQNGLFGAISFYKSARKKGIKPIIGLDTTVEGPNGKTYQLTLLAKNNNGYRSLVEINSRAYLENRKSDSVAIKSEWIADGLEDVIILSGGRLGEIGQLILADKYEEAKDTAREMQQLFGDDFYIELQRDGTADESKYMAGAVRICSELGIAPVATHPTYFLHSEDYIPHEARYTIGAKLSLFDIKREKKFNKDMYFKTPSEMADLFSDIPEAIQNTEIIAQRCNIGIELDNPQLPNFPTPEGVSSDDYFEKLAKDGLEERLLADYPNPIERARKTKEYQARLDYEIDIIKKMGFPGYFLIVGDFITWAKNNDIPVGPGRGSGAGSLVAYSMKITDIDPLQYNLLFERFLNPDRVSMPDFDIDFCQSRRGEVYEYVRQKYGEKSVGQIGTFGTMAAKAVVKDVGRTLNYPYGFMDGVSKMINIKPAHPITLQQFIFGDESKGIQPDAAMLARYHDEEDFKQLIDIATKIEGLTRQVGTHAAGVVISPTVLTDFTPLYAADADSAPATQFSMKDVESSGLVKFDFLGLKNLTIIKNTVDLINEQKAENNEQLLDIRRIKTNEPEVYANIYANGNTVGIFQFEGKGMTSVLQKAVPQKLEDLIAINALYRPGPMDIIPEWLASKNTSDELRQYPDDRLKPILEETYGFMIYQEQVMQCAQIIAGYSLGEADLLRRAMGKKKPEEMAAQRAIFIKGAVKNGVSEQKANDLFNLIDKFSGYGFNKSHAAAYSFLSYQTGYLKHHYPSQFFAASMNNEGADRIAILVDDARKNQVSILPADINKSLATFSTENTSEGNGIRYGLVALKWCGEKAAEGIVIERKKNGEYKSFQDLIERVPELSKRVVESLIQSGALDCFGHTRAAMFDSIAEYMDYAKKYRKRAMEGASVLGSGIFDDAEPAVKKKSTKEKKALVAPVMAQAEEWDDITKLRNEKDSIGFYFSSNPYRGYYSQQLGGLPTAEPASDLVPSFHAGNTDIFTAGIIEEIKPWKSKKGAFVTITDGIGNFTASIFSDALEQNKQWLVKDSFIAIKGKLDQKPDAVTCSENEDLSISANQVFNFEQTKILTAEKVFVAIDETQEQRDRFYDILKKHTKPQDNRSSSTPIVLCSKSSPTQKSKQIGLVNCQLSSELINELTQTFSDKWVKIKFLQDKNKINFPSDQRKKQRFQNSGNRRPAFSA